MENKDFKKVVGHNIKMNRVQREMSQRELAEKIGCTTTMLSQYENGLYSPSLSLFYNMTKALNVDASELFKGVNE